MSPAIALPMAPRTAAITMRRMSPGNVIVMPGPFRLPMDPARAGFSRSQFNRYYSWNWMFPFLMTRCDLASDSPPVTVIPN